MSKNFNKLSPNADDDSFCSINIVPSGQLYGGKVCAAMDRQHPRDIFDVKQLLQKEGFTKKIKEGFLFRLLSTDRSIQDVLFQRALESGANTSAIVTEKQRLRDITNLVDSCISTSELRNIKVQ